MRCEQRQWAGAGWGPAAHSSLGAKADLVLVFGDTALIKDQGRLREIQAMYPNAHQFGCSTSGEISGTSIYDDTLSLVAIHFEHTALQHAQAQLRSVDESFRTGKALAEQLAHENLRHVLVLSIGLNVNGAELVKGLTAGLPANVSLSGGLAGDRNRFQETVVLAGGVAGTDTIAIVGFYGDRIKVGSASLGGWDAFGPERLISRSKGSILYELDGRSALELYKAYLGKHAASLPASALSFPLCLRTADGEEPIVRTILGIDEKEQSLILAGDLPEGSYVRMMKTNLDRLIEGARGAATSSSSNAKDAPPELALLISCVGRRMVLKQRAEEEEVNERIAEEARQGHRGSAGVWRPPILLVHSTRRMSTRRSIIHVGSSVPTASSSPRDVSRICPGATPSCSRKTVTLCARCAPSAML